MTDADKKRRGALIRLADALVEDMLATSDQEIVAEFIETQGEPSKNAEAMRALFEKSVLETNKNRLRAAQAGLAADRATPTSTKIVSMANVRDRLRRALATCPPDMRLTLAARNESELSDADVLGMLQDLEELGIVAPDDESGSQS
jgi:hypothetical protein